MTRQKICLIGGTGFVGRSLARRLIAFGKDVVVISRHRERHRSLLVHPTLRLVQGDVFDDAVLDKHFAGAEAVVNLAGVLNQSRAQSQSFDTVHEALPRRVGEACLRQGVPRLLHVSALGADTDGPSDYLRSKGRGEEAISALSSGGQLGVTVFRPSVIFGREDDFINRFAKLLRSAPLLPLACPDAKFQPIAVNDVVHAIVTSLNDASTIGECYELAGPSTYTLEQIVKYVNEVGGTGCKVVRLGEGASKFLAKVLQFAPGKPLTPDNLASMSVDSVSEHRFIDLFGIEPVRLEDEVPLYVQSRAERLDTLRRRRS